MSVTTGYITLTRHPLRIGIVALLWAGIMSGAMAEMSSEMALVVVGSNYLERQTASSPLPHEQQAEGVSIVAAPSEYEPATLSVRAGGQALKDVLVKLRGDLKSDAGEAIPAAAVQIRVVEPFERCVERSYSAPISKAEIEANKQREWLLPRLEKPVTIEAHAMRRFWLTVHVPSDAKAGTYRSEIAIEYFAGQNNSESGSKALLKLLKFELTVLPIRLATAAETGMAFLAFNDTNYYAQEAITPEYQRRVLADMREHGMTTATLYVHPHVRDGRVDLDAPRDRFLSFSQWMSLLKETGLPAQGLPVLWLGNESYPTEVWKAVLEERARRDWPEIVFYAIDEPGEEDRNVRVRAFMERFNAFRSEHPEYKARVTTAIGETVGIKTVGHHYDFWIGCMGQKGGEIFMIDAARRMQKQLWTYDCMLAPVDAETDRYYFGIWAWASGVRGCAHWAFYDGNPRLSYVYPAADEIIPTIGWEAVREGIDDYRYLFTLKQLAERARTSGRADMTAGAERIFADVSGMVTMDNYGRSYLESLKPDSVAVPSAYQRQRVEPNLDIAAYDQLRQRVAQEIQNLAGALSEVSAK